MTPQACPDCLARSWLIGELAGHLDAAVAEIGEVLALSNHDLIAAVGGRRQAALERELAGFSAWDLEGRIDCAGLHAVCRCDPAYPERLAEVDSAPAVVYVAGSLDRLVALAAPCGVAVVGSRRPTSYGLDVAGWLGRGLAVCGIPVISGMALGVDSAAHDGALAGGGSTIAVLPGCAARAYPASRRALHGRISEAGVIVSELPPGTTPRRWMFPARNRIIAALAELTVVVEAAEASGALITAKFAYGFGRRVGAVPGRITTPQAAGTNALLADGAVMVRGPQEAMELVLGPGAGLVPPDSRPPLDAAHTAVLEAIASGRDVPEAESLAALAWLELAGYLRRGAGGRYSVLP